MTKRILILSSNPRGTSALDLNIEIRKIRQALKGSDYIVETRGAVRPADLQQALLEVKPQIVHFCGHGKGSEGIVLMDDRGKVHLTSTDALKNLFEIFADSIECIVLNACYSEVQADAIAEHINYVIGMNRSILDNAAIVFAASFYQAVRTEDSIPTAYKIGRNAIQLEYPDSAAIERKLSAISEDGDLILPTPEHLVPVLKQKVNLSVLILPKPEEEPNFDKNSVKSLIGHADSVRAIAFTTNGKYIASCSNDCTVRLWQVETGQLVNLFKGHKERVKCLQISQDNKQIISGSADSTLKIWDIETGDCLETIKTSLNPKTVLNAVAINLEQQSIDTGSTSVQGTIKRWNQQTGEMLDAVNAAFSGINSLATSRDGKILVSGSGGRTIKIWHLDRGLKDPQVIRKAHTSDVLSLAIYNNTLVSGGKDRTIKLWNLETGEEATPDLLEGHAGSIWDLAISPDGTKIASASGDFTVKLWDIESGKLLETLTGHLGEVRTVAFRPDGRVLASAGDDWEIKLWEL